MTTLSLINGNNQVYNIGLPKIVILCDKPYNDVALQHIAENTHLIFMPCMGGMEAQPTDSDQITKLFMTYNFKTQYHNNGTSHNTLYLKSDHHQGFKVDSICFECINRNHINTMGLKEGDFLAC